MGSVPASRWPPRPSPLGGQEGGGFVSRRGSRQRAAAAFAAAPDSKGAAKTLFTQQFGSAGYDQPGGLVVDGSNLITASVEDEELDRSVVRPVGVPDRHQGAVDTYLPPLCRQLDRHRPPGPLGHGAPATSMGSASAPP